MNKQKYEAPVMEFIQFETEDVITASYEYDMDILPDSLW